jgi:hypothetical protein
LFLPASKKKRERQREEGKEKKRERERTTLGARFYPSMAAAG